MKESKIKHVAGFPFFIVKDGSNGMEPSIIA